MSNIRRKAVIAGIGETGYSRNSGKTERTLFLEAAKLAIADAGLTPKDIDGVMPDNPGRSSPGGVGGYGEFATNFGINDLRFGGMSNMGAAAIGSSIYTAATMVKAGVANAIVVLGGGNGRSGRRLGQGGGRQDASYGSNFEAPYGMMNAAQSWALPARRHMIQYGTTQEQYGAIALATRKHAQLNTKATMKGPMTMEDYLNSRIIADPYHLLDCCLESDGAAACVVTTAERAQNLPQKPVYIAGGAQSYGPSPAEMLNRTDITINSVRLAAPLAFREADITIADVDFAEIYDSFTFAVLSQIEDLGFCKKGEGGSFVEGGRIELGGELPINTHGGLLSQAHIWGMNHVAEAVKQLRGQAGAAQVPNAQVGVVSFTDMGGYGSVLVLTGV